MPTPTVTPVALRLVGAHRAPTLRPDRYAGCAGRHPDTELVRVPGVSVPLSPQATQTVVLLVARAGSTDPRGYDYGVTLDLCDACAAALPAAR